MKGIFAILLLTASLTGQAAEWLELQAAVAKVKDGNNLKVVDGQNVVHLVRLSGSDTPELTQKGGAKAWRRLRELVEDKTIRIVHRFFDEHGRILGKVYVGDTWVNRVLIEEGLAWYNDPDRDSPELESVEAAARRRDIGIWKSSRPIPPWHWRRGGRLYREGMEQEVPPKFPRYQSANEPRLIGAP